MEEVRIEDKGNWSPSIMSVLIFLQHDTQIYFYDTSLKHCFDVSHLPTEFAMKIEKGQKEKKNNCITENVQD